MNSYNAEGVMLHPSKPSWHLAHANTNSCWG